MRKIAVSALVGTIFAATVAVAAPATATAVTVAAASTVGRTTSAHSGLASSAPSAAIGSSLLTSLAAATLTPSQAVARASSEAAANGITDYLSVVDRSSGAVLAQSGNAGTQVASESIMKLFLASYYMVLVGGYQHQSQNVRDQLSYMIRYSDDATADAYFTSSAIPTMAARYGLHSTINATDRAGHWGAARITAHDMTTFLFRAAHDSEVGPWLLPVMAQVAPSGSDGFNQHFGMNSLAGTHGSKQGWGQDQFWTSADSVINSVGYTDRYYVAILQLSYSYPDPARATSTYAAHDVQASRVVAAAPPRPTPLRDGNFVKRVGSAQVYRLAGGAPIAVTSWAAVGGSKPTTTLTAAQFARLRALPVDGTFIKAGSTGEVYRIVAGTPTYVSSWTPFRKMYPTTVVDAAAIARAGQGGPFAHLRGLVPDGTFILSTAGGTYRIAGGAPVFVSSWTRFGRVYPVGLVDAVSITNAGRGGHFNHMRAVPADGTYVTAAGSRTVFRIVGGAPLLLTSWAPVGGMKPTIAIDPVAIANAGHSGGWSHLRFYPSDGSFLRGMPGGRIYRTSGGRAIYVSSWARYGGPKPSTTISQATVDRAGTGGYYNHLKK